ncbi:MAG: aquaporin [Alphaproteobacteria bacterium]|nr:aquaporin [Alphaproteobacteria bacterium]
MKREIAEFIGTFTLVLFGCGAAVIAGGQVGVLGVALAFGLALMAMMYSIGHISGCHLNPAVSFGMFVSGRMSLTEFLTYAVAQCLGALLGTFVLSTIVADGSGLAANTVGDYGTQAAFVFEFIAAALFVVVYLGMTDKKSKAGAVGGLAIGLTYAMIYIVGISMTGGGVNPARSLGPAVFAGGAAMDQLWLFFIAPLGGALLAGVLSKMGWFDAD